MIGTTFGSMEHLDHLTIPILPPKSTFSPYAKVVDLADGSTRGVGAPVAAWHWDFLPQEARDQLRTFCAGASSDIYIRTATKDTAGAFRYFTCKMKWPVRDEETKATRAIDFIIEFTQLVDVTPL